MQTYLTILTGATSGIGYETAKALCERKHHLILGNRNPDKADKLKTELLSMYPDAKLDFFDLDLASFESIRNFVLKVKEQHQRIDYLINNAGVFVRRTAHTNEGFEMTMGVNHLGTMYLTELLLETYAFQYPKNIFMVSSIGCYWGSIPMKENLFLKRRNSFKNYFDSKLANLAYAKVLSETLQKKGILVKASDPGVVYSHIWKWKTRFGRFLGKIQKRIMKSASEGAVPILKLIDGNYPESGNLMYNGKKFRKLPRKIRNSDKVNAFIDFSKATIQKHTSQ